MNGFTRQHRIRTQDPLLSSLQALKPFKLLSNMLLAQSDVCHLLVYKDAVDGEPLRLDAVLVVPLL